MSIKLGVLMDPIESIHYKKDSTLAMLWEAKARGWMLYYMEQRDVFAKNNKIFAHAKKLDVFQDEHHWYHFDEEIILNLSDLDVILMRKDPPFDQEYIYTTHLLSHVEQSDTLIINRTQSLR